MYDEAVNQQKNDLSVLVGIGREILILLKCIVGLVYLVLFGIVYIVLINSCLRVHETTVWYWILINHVD